MASLHAAGGGGAAEEPEADERFTQLKTELESLDNVYLASFHGMIHRGVQSGTIEEMHEKLIKEVPDGVIFISMTKAFNYALDYGTDEFIRKIKDPRWYLDRDIVTQGHMQIYFPGDKYPNLNHVLDDKKGILNPDYNLFKLHKHAKREIISTGLQIWKNSTNGKDITDTDQILNQVKRRSTRSTPESQYRVVILNACNPSSANRDHLVDVRQTEMKTKPIGEERPAKLKSELYRGSVNAEDIRNENKVVSKQKELETIAHEKYLEFRKFVSNLRPLRSDAGGRDAGGVRAEKWPIWKGQHVRAKDGSWHGVVQKDPTETGYINVHVGFNEDKSKTKITRRSNIDDVEVTRYHQTMFDPIEYTSQTYLAKRRERALGNPSKRLKSDDAGGGASEGGGKKTRKRQKKHQTRKQKISHWKRLTNKKYSHKKNRTGYRSDCSGFVSYMWGIPPGKQGGAWTKKKHSNNILKHAREIKKKDLQYGDAIYISNQHIILFDKWANQDHSAYYAYQMCNRGDCKGFKHIKTPFPYDKKRRPNVKSYKLLRPN